MTIFLELRKIILPNALYVATEMKLWNTTLYTAPDYRIWEKSIYHQDQVFQIHFIVRQHKWATPAHIFI